MANIKGGKSTQIALRLPNDLYDSAMAKAKAENMVNDDGEPSTTLIVVAAIKAWLGVSDFKSEPRIDIVEQLQSQIKELSDSLANTVKHSEIAEILSNSQSDRTLPEDDLTAISDRLNRLENIINDFILKLPSLDDKDNHITKLENHIFKICDAISVVTRTLERKGFDIDNVSTKLTISEAIANETKTDSHLYPVGVKVSKTELASWLGFHKDNYTTKARNKGLTPEEYLNSFAEVKGEYWQELEMVKGGDGKKYFQRVS